ncbi:MAG TPA: hypothetical protein VLH79_08270 [Chthonomonadales bacterium]|nr:hypothetical protein [Chthonomonadales bacterium]
MDEIRNGHGSGSGDPRKRRLEELFADAPHLSPTMKARLLSQKLGDEVSTSESPGLPDAALIADMSVASTRVERADGGPAISSGAHADLRAAAGFLRAGCPPGRLDPKVASRLIRFRADVLQEWLRLLPPRCV